MTNDRHADHAIDDHATDAPATDDHAGAQDHEDHGHGEVLGPIDVAAWGAGALGIVLGLAVAVAFYFATLSTAAA